MKFIYSTPPIRPMLTRSARDGGGSEVGPERDAWQPNGWLTWGSRVFADHTHELLQAWIQIPDRIREQHPVTHPNRLDRAPFPSPEFHPYHEDWDGDKEPG